VKLNEAESCQTGLTFEERWASLLALFKSFERFELSKEVVQLRAEKARLEVKCEKLSILLVCVSTGCYTFLLGRHQIASQGLESDCAVAHYVLAALRNDDPSKAGLRIL